MTWLAILLLAGAGLHGAWALLRWGTRWGSTAAERARTLPGDEFLDGHAPARVAMTRAVSIAAIGYLRHVDRGTSLVWWLGEARFLGASVRSVMGYYLEPEGTGTRLVSRISADGRGPLVHVAFLAFRVLDSIMASRQLVCLRTRAESDEAARAASRGKETGDRAQFQRYEILYADGGHAGIAGKEHGARSREAAIRDGVLRRRSAC